MSCSYCGFSKPNQKTACCGQTYCNQICLSNNLDQHHFQCIGEEYTKEEIEKANKWWDSLDWFVDAKEYNNILEGPDKKEYYYHKGQKIYVPEMYADNRRVPLLNIRNLILLITGKLEEFWPPGVSNMTDLDQRNLDVKRAKIQAFAHKYMGYPMHGIISSNSRLKNPTKKFVKEKKNERVELKTIPYESSTKFL